MSKWWLFLIGATLLLGRLAAQPDLAVAARLVQDDPTAQWAEGAQLAFAGQVTEALPLLEAGFAHQETATPIDPNNLGQYALLHKWIGRTLRRPGFSTYFPSPDKTKAAQ